MFESTILQVVSNTSISMCEEDVVEVVIHLNLPVLNAPIWVDIHIPKGTVSQCYWRRTGDALLVGPMGCRAKFEVSEYFALSCCLFPSFSVVIIVFMY